MMKILSFNIFLTVKTNPNCSTRSLQDRSKVDSLDYKDTFYMKQLCVANMFCNGCGYMETRLTNRKNRTAWFPIDRNRIVKSCDSSRFLVILARLITIESKNVTEIGSDFQSKGFLS